MTDMRTPLKRIRGLGATGTGTEHFWHQRLTAVSNLILVTTFIVIVVSLAGEPWPVVVETIANPLIALVLILAFISVTYHMRLGMQVIIEDYVHSGLRVFLLLASTFYAIAIAFAAIFAIVRISLLGF